MNKLPPQHRTFRTGGTMGEKSCKAIKTDGMPCKNHSYQGTNYCYIHSYRHFGGMSIWKHPLFHTGIGIIVTCVVGYWTLQHSATKSDVDKIALNQQKMEFEIQQMKQRMTMTDKKYHSLWSQKYTYGYALFGIKERTFVFPNENRLSQRYSLDWTNAKITEISERHVMMNLPDVYDKVGHNLLAGNTARMARTGIAHPEVDQGIAIPLNTLRIELVIVEDTGPELTLILGLLPRE